MSHLSQRWALTLETRRFTVLFVALALALFVIPLVSSAESQQALFRLAVAMVLAAGLYAASSRRATFTVALVLLAPAAFAWLGPNYLPGRVDDVIRLLTIFTSLVFTAGVVLQALMRHRSVTRETLLGGINVYLLLVFAFALAHTSVEIVHHGSYSIGGRALLAHLQEQYAGHSFPTIVYFSVTTLSTLGYGDIVPTSEGARILTSIEALVGQLYIAIFIGRLVGIQVGESMAARSAGSLAHSAVDEAASS
jgi:hypothetical protein